jgi:ElaB/YqjD/DUF883 family membrane-anchored ribosome-binding protein
MLRIKESHMAQSYESRAESLASEAQDRVQQLKSKAEDAANKVSREGARALKSAEETAENAYAATSRFVRDQPILAIGIAAGFAFAVGALWKAASSYNRNDSLIDRVSDYLEPQYRALRRKL